MDAQLDQIRLAFSPQSLAALNAILGLLMFGVALDLKVGDFVRVARDPRGPLVGLAAQFVLLPAATWGLTMLLRPPPSVALGMILVASCPGGNLSNFMTWLARGNTALSVGMTATSTAAAVVLTPANIALWGALNPDTARLLRVIALDPFAVFFTVLLILGVPLGLGMAVGARWPALAARARRPVRWAGIAVFLAFVALAVRANGEHFTLLLVPAFGMVVLHNASALALGYGAARLLKVGAFDARAIAIEVGIQNSGLGLVLIFNFFEGLGGMAVVAAFWGIWHIVSGLSLAWFWSSRPVPAEPQESLSWRPAPRS